MTDPLFSPSDVEMLRQLSIMHPSDVFTHFRGDKAVKDRAKSLADRLQSWLDQHPTNVTITGCYFDSTGSLIREDEIRVGLIAETDLAEG